MATLNLEVKDFEMAESLLDTCMQIQENNTEVVELLEQLKHMKKRFKN